VTVTLRKQPPIPPPLDQDARVRREVWQSLLSMLRVYAYATSLSHGEILVIETSPDRALLEHKGHTLVLGFDVRSGQGSCLLPGSKKVEGGFEILADGRLRFAGIEKQLDEAALDWVEQLTGAESQPPQEAC
jgi:hypothetical protein